MSWLSWLRRSRPAEQIEPPPEEIFTFRGLYHALTEASGTARARELLARAIEDGHLRSAMELVVEYRRPERPSFPYRLYPGRLWMLYAASRLSDLLLLSLQGRDGEPSPFPGISGREYVDFFRALGFETIGNRPYSPFFHEIVEVAETDDAYAGIQIERQLWPGLMLGDLLFARSGVRIRAHPTRIRGQYAETTLLCYSYLRHRRRAADRSLGWGRNSQWSTRFRRDYVDGDWFRFNVDGEVDISGPEPRVLQGMEDFDAELPIEARRELLVNRCFVTQAYPWETDEDWPWRDALTIRRDDPLVAP